MALIGFYRGRGVSVKISLFQFIAARGYRFNPTSATFKSPPIDVTRSRRFSTDLKPRTTNRDDFGGDAQKNFRGD